MSVEPRPPAPAWIRTFWPGPDIGLLDQDLPGGQRYQWHRGRLVHGQGCGFEGHIVLVDGDVFGEGADPQVPGPRVHLVADSEPADARADAGDHTGNVVAKDERGLVLQQLFEFAVADHDVQRVDARGAHLDEYVPVADGWLGQHGRTDLVLAVSGDDKSLHEASFFLLVHGMSRVAVRVTFRGVFGHC